MVIPMGPRQPPIRFIIPIIMLGGEVLVPVGPHLLLLNDFLYPIDLGHEGI